MEFTLADESAGIAITLEPRTEDRLLLEVVGGVAPGSIHLTLAVAVGDPAAIDMAALLTAVLPVAAGSAPIAVTVDGVAQTTSGGGVLVDAPDADALATAVAEALTAAGLTVDPSGFTPLVLTTAAEAPPADSIGTGVTFDNIGVRFGGQTLLIPFAAVEADPITPEAPVAETPTPESTPTPAPAEAAAVEGAVEAATVDELVEGAAVSWTDPDGTVRTGVVMMLTGLDADVPTVTVAPDDAPDQVLDIAVADLTLGPVPADPAAVPVEPVEEGPVAEEFEVTYDVVVDHPDCTGPEGTVAVIVFVSPEDTGTLNSCHVDTDAAQAAIEALIAEGTELPEVDAADAERFAEGGEEAPPAEEEPANNTAFIGEGTDGREAPTPVPVTETEEATTVSGFSDLERAAALAAEVTATLATLRGIDPTAPAPRTLSAQATLVSPYPAPAAIIEEHAGQLVASGTTTITREGSTLTIDADGEPNPALADVSDDDIVAELARRFADGVVGEVKGVEIDVTIDATDADAPAAEAAAEGAATAADEPVPPVAEDGAVVLETAPGAMGDAFSDSSYDWEGVLIVEGLPSGDGRMIAEQALTHRELPIPLMLQTVNAQGHDGSVICGSIHEIIRVGHQIMGRGMFDSGANGQEAARLLGEGTMRGVSADIDSVIVEFLTEDGQPADYDDVMMGLVDAIEVLVEGRVMGATLTPFPAFQEAHVKVLPAGNPDEAMVASGSDYLGDVWRFSGSGGAWLPGRAPEPALVASASPAADDIVDVPVAPPAAWFAMGEMTTPEPFTIHPDGRCYGLVARFGTCHIGFTQKCVDVPKTGSAYKHFRNKMTLTEEGTLVATGPIFMDTVHPSLKLQASDAQAFYAHTGCAYADVALYENEFGIVAAGALRTGLTHAQVRVARGSDVSPDWRKIGGRLEAVGLLAVNTSGFVVEGLVASATGDQPSPMVRGRYDSVNDEVTALVAAGMVRKAAPAVSNVEVIAALTGRVEAMGAILEELVTKPERERKLAEATAKLGLRPEAEIRAAKLAEATAALGIQDGASCDCGGHEAEACACPTA